MQDFLMDFPEGTRQSDESRPPTREMYQAVRAFQSARGNIPAFHG
jgi:hypothetical protein